MLPAGQARVKRLYYVQLATYRVEEQMGGKGGREQGRGGCERLKPVGGEGGGALRKQPELYMPLLGWQLSSISPAITEL